MHITSLYTSAWCVSLNPRLHAAHFDILTLLHYCCCAKRVQVQVHVVLTPDCHAGNIAEEEVMYTVFNLAQFLGFVEVVRREGPREDAFLQAGNPQGSDTLATLVEGLRFVMSAASGNLVVSFALSSDTPGSSLPNHLN